MAYVLKTNLANGENYGGLRSASQIKYIVIHYTSNDGDTDENNGIYFKNSIVKASAHYFIDDDSVTQSVPDNYVAWAVGGKKYSNCGTTGGGKYHGICTNTNSLSIEICDDVKNGVVYPSDATIENVLQFTKLKMKEYNIPLSNVIRHFDVTGKSCPAYWCGTPSKDEKWKTEFWNKLKFDSKYNTAPTRNYLMKGDIGDAVKTLQENLIYIGYSCGKYGADGDFGNDTDSALRKFQKDNNLTVDGKYGVASKTKLEQLVAEKKNPKPKANPIIKEGQRHAIEFTGVQIEVDGIVGSETKEMKSRVLQHAMNLDYGFTIEEDGEFGTKSKTKLGTHYVEKGEEQYMVTAAEILMELNGIDPNGVEYPGEYGNGLTKASKQFFKDDGLKITASEFLKLL